MLKYFIYIFSFFLTVSVLVAQSDAPVKRNIIQFTGVVFAPDSNSVIPGVHVYVPTAGRGTTTNPYGFFSLPVLEGDSLVFSAVGFKRQYYIVPEHKESTSLKVLITMQEDVTLLSEVEVFPIPQKPCLRKPFFLWRRPIKSNIAT